MRYTEFIAFYTTVKNRKSRKSFKISQFIMVYSSYIMAEFIKYVQ